MDRTKRGFHLINRKWLREGRAFKDQRKEVRRHSRLLAKFDELSPVPFLRGSTRSIQSGYYQVKKKRACLFCGAPCNSREHVIPEWLSKAMEIRDFAFQPAHFTEGKGLELRPAIKCEHFRTRQVCKKCNSGWMSDLEGWAKAKIGSAVAPGFSLNAMNQLLLPKEELDSMTRWLLKTAIISS
jgi:hypothetical protein